MKKIDKSLVISKTLIFLFVVGFVIAFKSIFGEENTLIGVTTITATLMFLSRDLTVSPIRNTLRFITLNLLMGIISFFAVQNIWIGLILNFLMLFSISYIYSYNLREPMYLAFSLQYLFLLSTPVSDDKILIRLIALGCGALVIMLAQLLANRTKLSKSGNKILIQVCDCILSRFFNEDGLTESNSKDDITHLMDDLRGMVYDKRDSDNYMTEEARIKLGMSVALENLYMHLESSDVENVNIDILEHLKTMLYEVKNMLSNQSSDTVYDFQEDLHALVNICGEKNIKDRSDLKLLDSMVLLADTSHTLKNLDTKKYNEVTKCTKDFSLFSDKTKTSLSFGSKSIRFCYAMRVGISISLSSFIMDVFNVVEGRWLLFTLLSLTTPIYEVSKSKIRERVIATVVGAFIVFVLFSFIKDPGIRSILIILNGYIGGYFPQYKYNMIFVTISAIGAAAVVGDLQVLTFSRISLVAIGAIIAILSNEYIFPYRVKDSNKQLKDLHNEVIISMVKELNLLMNGEKRPVVMKNLFIFDSVIASKCRVNAKLMDDSKYANIIKERRYLATSIYELYMWILNEDINKEYAHEDIIKISDMLIKGQHDLSSAKIHIEEEINSCEDINTRIVLSSLLDIIEELQVVNNLEIESII